MKMAPSLVRLYEQMPEPKYVIAMGACTITGGMFSTDSYSTVRGIDKLILVDVYLPGCPPKPEAVIDVITKLRKKISRELYEERMKSQTKNRCFTINHNFRVGRSIHTGNYDQGLLYKFPSTSEIPPETFFKYKSSASSPKLCAYDVAPGGLLASVYHLTRIEYGVDQPEEVAVALSVSGKEVELVPVDKAVEAEA
uniref:NADH:ubiquinone oxidoreductase-like 20kDa subunit domain-containing protein n=1 Tax=Chenopodium quinoa TaxID=63459 RepID=A0A803LJS0_CHEQI